MTLRLRTLASFVEPSDKICDIGCDHAYLPIYLIENEIINEVYATEINQNAFLVAKNNIKKNNLENKIKLVLTDGINDLKDSDVDTLIIAGMGTSTILNIVNNAKNKDIKKLIIQSNNDLPFLRKKIRKYGFYLTKEKMVLDKNKWYTIGVYAHKKRHLKSHEIYYGYYDNNNIRYYQEECARLNILNNQVSFKNIKRKIKILYKIHLIKKYL